MKKNSSLLLIATGVKRCIELARSSPGVLIDTPLLITALLFSAYEFMIVMMLVVVTTIDQAYTFEDAIKMESTFFIG